MKPAKFAISLLVLTVLMIASPALVALAWPDQPPDAATISGPGLAGEVPITDPAALKALQLGAFEDFNRGALAAQPVGLGAAYRITRYFYSGTFNFATLYYCTDQAGRAYVRFEDGAQLTGSHTPFNGKWLYVTPQGQAAMNKLLPELGVKPSLPLAAASAPLPAGRLSLAVALIAAVVVVGVAVFRPR